MWNDWKEEIIEGWKDFQCWKDLESALPKLRGVSEKYMFRLAIKEKQKSISKSFDVG